MSLGATLTCLTLLGVSWRFSRRAYAYRDEARGVLARAVELEEYADDTMDDAVALAEEFVVGMAELDDMEPEGAA